MATYSNSLVVVVSGAFYKMAATDTISLANMIVTGTLDLTGCTISGLTVPAGATVTDSTGTLGFSGAAGALSGSGITTISLAGGLNSAVSYTATGTGTFAARSATGTATYGDGTGTQVFSGSGGISYSGVTTYALSTAGAISLNSTGGIINIGNNADNQDINIGSGGTRTITIGSATGTVNLNSTGGNSTWTVNSSSTAAWRVYDGTTDMLSLNTVADALTANVSLVQGQGTNAAPKFLGTTGLTAGEILVTGNVLYMANASGTTKYYKAVNTTADAKLSVVGASGMPAAADAAFSVASNGYVPVLFGTAPAAASNGALVYLDATAGQGTLTLPSASGTSVVVLGKLYGANGSDTVVRVLWAPQYLYANA